MKTISLDLLPADTWLPYGGGKIWVAGPCSAETAEQVMDDALRIASEGTVKIFRSGIWKPRTRPNAFEGVGEPGLQWLRDVKSQTGLLTTVEVANADHVELALKYGIDILWIGARTTVNPFSVQEIADALTGVDIPVLVKNPVNPDLNLWIGALERINKAGIRKLAAVHRGFTNYESTGYRNSPRWELPIQLMTLCPGLKVICDPSHIGGKREFVAEIAQKAMNLGFHGLMIETHPSPETAWSDADQQVTPARLHEILAGLVIPEVHSDDVWLNDRLAQLRRIIDSIDEELVQIIGKRMKVIEEIGYYKRDNNITIFQLERWNEIIQTRSSVGSQLGLDPDFILRIMQEIHQESILRQTEILNKEVR